MLPVWFFWIQVLTCLLAGIALFYHGHNAFGWTWCCYAAANLGFVYGVK